MRTVVLVLSAMLVLKPVLLHSEIQLRQLKEGVSGPLLEIPSVVKNIGCGDSSFFFTADQNRQDEKVVYFILVHNGEDGMDKNILISSDPQMIQPVVDESYELPRMTVLRTNGNSPEWELRLSKRELESSPCLKNAKKPRVSIPRPRPLAQAEGGFSLGQKVLYL